MSQNATKMTRKPICPIRRTTRQMATVCPRDLSRLFMVREPLVGRSIQMRSISFITARFSALSPLGR